MIAPEDIPAWVPIGVRRMASASLLVNEDVLRMLLTDERMESVWSDLKRLRTNNLTRKTIDRRLTDLQRLETWDIRSWDLGPKDQAHAALFASLAIEFSRPPMTWTRDAASALAKEFDMIVERCIWVSTDPMFASDPAFQQAAKVTANGFETSARALRKTGQPIDLGRDAPYIPHQTGGPRRRVETDGDEMRRRVQAVTRIAKDIYGAYPASNTIETITKVAAGKGDFNRKNVANWRGEIIKHLKAKRPGRTPKTRASV